MKLYLWQNEDDVQQDGLSDSSQGIVPEVKGENQYICDFGGGIR